LRSSVFCFSYVTIFLVESVNIKCVVGTAHTAHKKLL